MTSPFLSHADTALKHFVREHAGMTKSEGYGVKAKD